MREYPSIRQSRKPFKAHVFDKLDGSNLRISWDIKQGWYELATRTRTISVDHNLYSKGYQYFLEVYAQEIEKIANKSNWKRLDAFFEFHGDNSFAGRHDLSETQRVTLIDLAPNTRGLLNLVGFLELLGHLPIPAYLGEVEWNLEYAEAVRLGEVAGISFEGVVAKCETKQRMAKAKTRGVD